MDTREKYFNNNIFAGDMFDMLCGNYISSGSSRSVYEFIGSDTEKEHVLKFERKQHSFQNVSEWEVWSKLEYTEFAKWFAPCANISPCGTILIQRQTTPCPAEFAPKRIPRFFTDIKLSNFGMLDGNFVCHDYGLHLLMESGMTKHMRKAEWCDED